MRLPNGLMINIYESSVGTGTQREVIIDPEALRDVVDRTLLAYSQLPASEFTPFAQKARERAESGDLKDSITTFVINTRDNTCFKMDKFGNYETARFIDQAPLPPPAQPGTIATVYDRQNSGCDAIGIQTHGDSNNSLIAVSGPISYPDSLPPPTSVLDTFIHELLHMNLSHGGRVERQDTDLGNREHAKYVNPGTSAVAREYHQSIEAGKSRSPFSYSGPIRPGGVSNKSNIIVSRR